MARDYYLDRLGRPRDPSNHASIPKAEKLGRRVVSAREALETGRRKGAPWDGPDSGPAPDAPEASAPDKPGHSPGDAMPRVPPPEPPSSPGPDAPSDPAPEPGPWVESERPSGGPFGGGSSGALEHHSACPNRAERGETCACCGAEFHVIDVATATVVAMTLQQAITGFATRGTNAPPLVMPPEWQAGYIAAWQVVLQRYASGSAKYAPEFTLLAMTAMLYGTAKAHGQEHATRSSEETLASAAA